MRRANLGRLNMIDRWRSDCVRSKTRLGWGFGESHHQPRNEILRYYSREFFKVVYSLLDCTHMPIRAFYSVNVTYILSERANFRKISNTIAGLKLFV